MYPVHLFFELIHPNLKIRLLALALLYWLPGHLISTVNAQDPVFSQYYMAPLQLNPGLAGLTEGPRIAANYRNQYPGFNQAYQTYALSFDQFFDRENIGIGFWLLSDDAGNGILKTIKAAGIFSYRLQLSDNTYTKMGAEVGLVQSTLNWNKLVFGDQIDDYLGEISPGGTPFPTEEVAPENNAVYYPDLGLGGIVYGRKLFAGASLRHLNRPDPNFIKTNDNLSPRLPMQFTLHAGGSFEIFRRWLRSWTTVRITPSVIFVNQGPLNQINGGATFDAGILSLGVHYRHSAGQSESLIAAIGLRTSHLRIGYSFDYILSGFPLSGGTHELGLVYQFEDGDVESRYNDCLRLFR